MLDRPWDKLFWSPSRPGWGNKGNQKPYCWKKVGEGGARKVKEMWKEW